MTRLCALVTVLVAGCGSSSSPSGSAAPSLPEGAKAVFTRVTLETANGLSGLAADDAGALWTVAERANTAYRIRLDGTRVASTEAFAVVGVPADTDLEGIAVLGPGRFAFGTEGPSDGLATVLLGELRGNNIAVTSSIDLRSERLGVPLERNHGAEGVCGFGDTIVAGIESVGVEDGRRWAPVVRIEHGAITRRHRVWLTTRTGKLSAVDCRQVDGKLEAIAIERHFEDTKLLAFTLGESEDITPRVLIDLGPVLAGKLNLEGIAWLPDHRIVAVVDNQWKTITGPNELLIFK